MNSKDIPIQSPLQGIIDKMMMRVNDPELTTRQLKRIIVLAVDMREGLLEAGEDESRPKENDAWANQAILDFTEIIIRANYRVQGIINPQIDIGSLDDQIREGLKEMQPKLK